jgi:hypothetical protein
MWAAAAANVLGSLGAAGAAKKKAKEDFKNERKLNEQEGVIGRQNAQFGRELDEYYKNQDRQEKMRGLAEFRKFSTVSDFAPQYQNTNPVPVIPIAKPNYNTGAYAPATIK